MKRLSTLTLLIIIFATSCQTSSKLGSSNLVQKRRYTKGFNLNIKKPVTSTEENYRKDNSEAALAEARKTNVSKSVKLISPTVELKTDASNERKLASEKLSQSLLNGSLNNGKTESEISTTPSKSAENEYPAAMNDRSSSISTQTALPAAGGGAEVTLLIIILTILLPPLGVALVYGLSGEFWLSLLLTIIFYFPGLIYSLIVIL